jgi:hypothetical protein
MHINPSISAVLLALNRDAHYSRPRSLPTRAEMSDRDRTDLSSLATQGHKIQDGVDKIERRLEDSEMADLRASEHFATPVLCGLALTHAQRSLTNSSLLRLPTMTQVSHPQAAYRGRGSPFMNNWRSGLTMVHKGLLRFG